MVLKERLCEVAGQFRKGIGTRSVHIVSPTIFIVDVQINGQRLKVSL